jgi:hypothetical protein
MDLQSKVLNDPAEFIMNLRVQAKLPIKMCKIEGPTSRTTYCPAIFQTATPALFQTATPAFISSLR